MSIESQIRIQAVIIIIMIIMIIIASQITIAAAAVEQMNSLFLFRQY